MLPTLPHPARSYARGYSALWDAFLYQQQELAARVPYMVRQTNKNKLLRWKGCGRHSR